MKILVFFLVSFFIVPSTSWHTNLNEAKQIAIKDHKHILLNFSGSDWCGPCIRLHKEIFGSDAFAQYAKDHLVLVNADFPRLKKNGLSKEQEKRNEVLADKYDKQGHFPYTVLLDEKGAVVKTWDGYPNVNPEQFILQVKASIDAHK